MNTIQTTHSNEVFAQTEYTYFSDFVKDHIAQLAFGQVLTKNKSRYSDATIRGYKNFSDWWTKFEQDMGRPLEFSHIMPKTVQKFELFLLENQLTKNSVSLILSKLKACLKTAFLEGIHYWNGSGISTPKEITTKIYLTLDNLKTLTNSETQITKGEQRVLDVFICQCFLGLRYSTLQKFLSSPFNYIKTLDGMMYLDIVSDKTNEQSVVPIGQVVQDLITKYSGSMPMFTEIHLNKVIKDIARKRGLTNNIAVRKTIGGEMSETFSPIYKEISSHTARRTFITLATQFGIAGEQVMAMSGHASEKQMKIYVRSSNFEKISSIIGHEFFNQNIY